MALQFGKGDVITKKPKGAKGFDIETSRAKAISLIRENIAVLNGAWQPKETTVKKFKLDAKGDKIPNANGKGFQRVETKILKNRKPTVLYGYDKNNKPVVFALYGSERVDLDGKGSTLVYAKSDKAPDYSESLRDLASYIEAGSADAGLEKAAKAVSKKLRGGK